MRLVALTTVISVPDGGAEVTTVGAPVKLVPVTVTEVPPAWGPVVGLTRGDRRRTGVVGVGVGQWRGRHHQWRWSRSPMTVPVPAGTVTVKLVAVTR